MGIEFEKLVHKYGLVAVIVTPLSGVMHSFKVVGQVSGVFGIEILLMSPPTYILITYKPVHFFTDTV